MKRLLLYGGLFFMVACKSGEDKKAEITTEPAPLSQSSNTEQFNTAFGKLMGDYFHLKDNFITESDTIITVYAKNMMQDIDSLPFNGMKADTAIVETAKTSAQSMFAELKGLLGEKELEGKRKSFATLSEQLYDLIRTVQYDKAVIYHQHCPMAFNEAGANWLSSSADIKNPYIPKKMLTCGEVIDSLDFRKKN
ncbi:MAG: DUF3347 domain-containing protein [Bacteroidota bacterium]|nr:DUF3347 domain-containing protein [Bacteroidota bacterium]